tara:strand:- start:17857 stop:18036 length:180 start_codon:yes stop_codon:yes gene_type:complete
MPKSKHRKNQKQKSRARTEKLNAQKRAFNRQMQEQFQKYMEEMQNQKVDTDDLTNKENS